MTRTVSLSVFRFEGVRNRTWAFSQMGLARRALRRTPDIGFCKQFGSGTREGFHPVPNLGVYGILAAWPSAEIARQRVERAPVFRSYRAHAEEALTLYLSATASRGAWDGTTPFEPQKADTPPTPIAVLTRATVKPRHVIAFWTRTPDIESNVREQDHLLFKIGMGEVPWFQQVTFSVWDDAEAMKAFAYGPDGYHGKAVRKVRENGWFKEELYARFAVTGADGTWQGRDLPSEFLAIASQTTEAGRYREAV